MFKENKRRLIQYIPLQSTQLQHHDFGKGVDRPTGQITK